MSRPIIDGERKALFHRVSPSEFRFEGLVTRKAWEHMSAAPGYILATQRVTMGMALHVQSTKGQFPTVGTIFPAKLFGKRSGFARTGRQMDAHLTAIAAQRKAERQYASLLQGARKVIL